MDNTKNFIKWWLPPILYAILIFWLSSIEQPFPIRPETKYLDKLFHFLEYLVFGLLLIRAVCNSDPKLSVKTAILITFIIGTFYGLIDEIHQDVVPGRYACVSDFIFDSLGTLVGALIYKGRIHGEDSTI